MLTLERAREIKYLSTTECYKMGKCNRKTHKDEEPDHAYEQEEYNLL